MDENSISKKFSNICRTCAIYCIELFKIDDVRFDGVNLKEIFSDWTNLKINDDDGLPKNMCKSCIKLMYQMHRFRIQFNKASEVLLRILKKSLEYARKKSEQKFSVIEKIDIKYEGMDDETCVTVENGLDQIEASSDEESNDVDKDKKDIDLFFTEILSKPVKPTPKIKRPKSQRENVPIKCNTCDTIFSNYTDFKKHKLETKHESSQYTCPNCSKTTNSYPNYVRHLRTHNRSVIHKCGTCGKEFKSKSSLRNHSPTHMTVKPYKCKLCNAGFSTLQGLRDHDYKHTGIKLICSYCGKSFAARASLNLHVRLKHKTPNISITADDQVNSPTECKICNKTLKNKLALKQHVVLHGPKNFSCEICGRGYHTYGRLRTHNRSTHQEPKYSCNTCNKRFRQRSFLKDHMRRHCGLHKLQCDVCDKQFTHLGSFYTHKRMHSGNTKYQCKECLKICLNKRTLEDHIRSHTGEKPFECTFCERSFGSYANLYMHNRIHTGEKNHVCNLCGKDFYVRRSLTKHVTSVHKQHDMTGNIVD